MQLFQVTERPDIAKAETNRVRRWRGQNLALETGRPARGRVRAGGAKSDGRRMETTSSWRINPVDVFRAESR